MTKKKVAPTDVTTQEVETPEVQVETSPEPKAPRAVPRSTAESPTKLVWAIADAMPGEKRGAVVAACIAQGIATGTARTQYQKWSKAKKE